MSFVGLARQLSVPHVATVAREVLYDTMYYDPRYQDPTGYTLGRRPARRCSGVLSVRGLHDIVPMFRTLTSAVPPIRSLVTSPLHSGHVIGYTRTFIF